MPRGSSKLEVIIALWWLRLRKAKELRNYNKKQLWKLITNFFQDKKYVSYPAVKIYVNEVDAVFEKARQLAEYLERNV